MTQLPDGFVEKTYIVVDSSRLDKYLKEKFPTAEVCFVSDFEMNDGSSKVLSITNNPFNKWERKDFDRLIDGHSPGWDGPRCLMQRLCQQGVLPAGNYMVEVYW